MLSQRVKKKKHFNGPSIKDNFNCCAGKLQDQPQEKNLFKSMPFIINNSKKFVLMVQLIFCRRKTYFLRVKNYKLEYEYSRAQSKIKPSIVLNKNCARSIYRPLNRIRDWVLIVFAFAIHNRMLIKRLSCCLKWPFSSREKSNYIRIK